MALNTTIFIGSGSDALFNQTTTAPPEYLSYAMLFIVLLSIPVVIVPSLWTIIIILKNKKLQTNKNIFFTNLLLVDVGFAVAILCTNGLFTALYLLNVNVDVDCNLVPIPTVALFMATKLMFLPMCVDRFIHVAFPFHYKRIVTTKAITTSITTLWMVAI